MNLIEKLRQLGERVEEEFPRINQGGCCVYAAEVAKVIQQWVPVRIRAYNWTTVEEPLAALKVKNPANTMSVWYDLGLDFYHLVLEFDYEGETYRCDTSHTKKAEDCETYGNGQLLDGYFTLEEAEVLAADASGWNYLFDRESIPLLKCVIAEELTLELDCCAG